MNNKLTNAIIITFFSFLALGSFDSGSDSVDQRDEIKNDFSLDEEQIERGVRVFGSLSELESTLKSAKKDDIGFDEATNLHLEYGSFSNYKEAQEKDMSLSEYKDYQEEIELCSNYWKRCEDNAQLVNHYEGIMWAQGDCKVAAKKRAKYGDPDFPWMTSFSKYYSGDSYVQDGVIKLIETEAEYQNGFGVMTNARVECTYDLDLERVISISID